MSLQFLIGMVSAAIVSAGCLALQRHQVSLAAQAKVVEEKQIEQMAFQKRKTAAVEFHRELESTYSWISPVNCREVKCLALTFDDGPNPYTTPQVLTILEKEKVTASFFVVGSRVRGNEAILRRMRADGDEIGDHSWTHPDFTTLKPAQIRQQISLTQKAVENAGVPVPTLFRPPYGDINKTVTDNVSLTFMLWNEDPEDWNANDPQSVAKAVIASAKPGGVVDMHDIYHVTSNALDPIIKQLKAEHYHFVTVSQLLGLKPGQKGQFYGQP